MNAGDKPKEAISPETKARVRKQLEAIRRGYIKTEIIAAMLHQLTIDEATDKIMLLFKERD
jgi:hypothetical protein